MIRTCDLQLRRLLLYPAELWAPRTGRRIVHGIPWSPERVRGPTRNRARESARETCCRQRRAPPTLPANAVGRAGLMFPNDALVVDSRCAGRSRRCGPGSSRRTCCCRYGRWRRSAARRADRAGVCPVLDGRRGRRACAAVGAAGVGRSALRRTAAPCR